MSTKKILLILGGIVLLFVIGAAAVSAFLFTQFMKSDLKNEIVQSATSNLLADDSGSHAETATGTTAIAYLLLDDLHMTLTRDGEEVSVENMFPLELGDVIKVEEGSERILYPEYGMSKVLAGSTVTIAESPNAGGEAGIGLLLKLQAGEVWTRLDKLLGAEDDFGVEANDVIATVRGTGFGVKSSSSGLDIKVAEHQVRVLPAADYDNLDTTENYVTLEEGNKVVFDAANLRWLKSGAHTGADWFAQAAITDIKPLSSSDKQGEGFLFSSEPVELDSYQLPTIPLGEVFWFLDPKYDEYMRQFMAEDEYADYIESVTYLRAHPEEVEMIKAYAAFLPGMPDFSGMTPPSATGPTP